MGALVFINLSLYHCRWREAICVMMIYGEPGLTNEGLTRLGQQLGNLFRQVTLTGTSTQGYLILGSSF